MLELWVTLIEVKKTTTLKLEGRSWFLNFYIKTAMATVTSSNTFITFKSLKRRHVCSKNLEKLDFNGFLLQYKKKLQRSLISIAPSY